MGTSDGIVYQKASVADTCLGLAGALQQLVGQGGPLGGCVQQHAEAAVGEHGREHVGAPDAAPLDKYLRQ